MTQRILTAAVGIPLVALIFSAPVTVLHITIILIALLGGYEYLRFADQQHDPKAIALTYPALIAIILLPLVLPPSQLFLFAITMIVLVYIAFQIRLALWRSFAGIVYIGVPLMAFIALRREDDGLHWILLVIAATWTTDTWALFGGKMFGKTKLSSISPNKTWEGTLTGVACGAIAILIAATLFDFWDDFTLVVVLAALLLPPMAVIGDLAESKIKRFYGKKDSGGILPGHGGILDRVDSLLFTSLTLWMLLLLFG